tara:strand:+ start:810 stop:1040 length:231 start_codon:yes stop_codon:yes gene_type:complete
MLSINIDRIEARIVVALDEMDRVPKYVHVEFCRQAILTGGELLQMLEEFPGHDSSEFFISHTGLGWEVIYIQVHSP